ncbi:hypothetical protein [Hydrogenimonas sp.]
MKQRLHYAGPKPICSKYGVLFDYAKEDRYIYLDTLIQLLEAFDTRTLQEGTLRFGIKKEAFDGDVILEKTEKYDPEIGRKMEKAASETHDFLRETAKRVEENELMAPLEKEVWLKNIALMEDYVVQRAVNKAVYYVLIDLLAQKLKEGNVRYIVFPMHRNFHHVAKSLSNALAKQKPPIPSYAQILETKEGLTLKFNLTP